MVKKSRIGAQGYLPVDGCLFDDAVLWCFVRQFIRAPAGRRRFNVLGALNAVTHELVMVTNDTYITHQSVF